MEHQKIIRRAGIVGGATFLSRILGLARDIILGALFGKWSLDAFFIAFTIPNTLRRLLGEGALTVTFIPVFTDHIEHKGKREARKFVAASLGLLLIVLICLSTLGVIFTSIIVKGFAYGFKAAPLKFELTVLLTRIMFPYILLTGLLALSMGILNTLGRFAAPAFSPVLLNLSIIFSAIFISPRLSVVGIPSIVGIAAGVMLGGVLQLCLQVPFLIREKMFLLPRISLRHPGVKRTLKLMVPALFGIAIYQINIMLSRLFASFLEEGSVTYLYFAQRLIEFPLGIFVLALATATLPLLSLQKSRQQTSNFMKTLDYSLRLTFFLATPALLGLIILGEPILSVLFQRGKFTWQTTQAVAKALIPLAIGLWPIAGIRQIVAVYYAIQDMKTPVKVAAINLIIYTGLCIIFMKLLGYPGIALSISLAAFCQFFHLIFLLPRAVGQSLWIKSLLKSVFKSVICGVIMVITCIFLRPYGLWHQGGNSLKNWLLLIIIIILGTLVYFVSAIILKSPEIKELKESLLRRNSINEEGD
jgi:putative peptidoglycan lipid II flippase